MLFYTSHRQQEMAPAGQSPTSPNQKPLSYNSLSSAAASSDMDTLVADALAFEALLSASQQSSLQLTYTTTLARNWSNLPCGAGCRNGIEFGNLSSAQVIAAEQVIKDILSKISNNGYDEFHQISLADTYLKNNGGGNGYDSTLRWICFLNTPTATGAWMLQFGGHHYAANIAFNNGHVIGATPFFYGVEPTSFTMYNTTFTPIKVEHDTLAAMLASLTTAELATAHLTSSYTDCTMIPGETNGGTGVFPTTKVGISCGMLTSAQQSMVLAGIRHYVQQVDSTAAAAIMSVYTSQIDSTYLAYTGSGTSGDASTFLDAATNYVRLDGPTLWIEFICQNGIVFPNQIHYHTVWRDHSHDYGVDLTGAPIDSTSKEATGIAEITTTQGISIYPNPATNQISISLNNSIDNATLTIVSIATGQRVSVAEHFSGKNTQYDVSKLAAGAYLLRIEDGKSVYNCKFIKQ